ncbi:hypothetical protein FVEG_16382 [Fusarium verticillioides 7600]|uniref:Ricin B lectin domain-containing protein n=1 Tax=Gibberella moniliformis (strain M3125 / FGSC 7600) TaxID=334819 RepID=W7MDE7_GIBM7|nr:hypothetical protein FVEG_16382 [Fusarium verticillioides 7600]EWG49006.1 hypothetical protein FVEG_16382 [Fusarium verticillioides 7600]
MTSKAMLQTNQDTNSNDANLHVWPVKRDKQTVEAYWHWFNFGRYMLRYSQTDADKQLAVSLSNDTADADMRTRPCLLDASNDKTQLWDVAQWKPNNTYGFISVHNGTKFHLECIPNGPVFMSSDVDDTWYQTRQHWLMTGVSSVTDKAFNTTVSEASPPIHLKTTPLRPLVQNHRLQTETFEDEGRRAGQVEG